jgi:hypothetical protein
VRPLRDFESSHLVKTFVRAGVSAAILVDLYYVFPIEHRVHQSVALRLDVALVFFQLSWPPRSARSRNRSADASSRIVAMVQMLSDLAVLAVVVRLILGAATSGMARLRTSGE